MRTPPVEERKRRMTAALKFLRSKTEMDYDHAVSLLSWNLGVTERKAKEYIKTLVNVDGIRKEGRKIVRVKPNDE